MASEKQLLANRRNSQRSTGPRTPEGKAAISQNALKHGLRARGILFVPTDEELRTVRDCLAAEWRPQNQEEQDLLEQMAVALYRRARFEELESDWQVRLLDPEFPPALMIISRRQAALTRSYCKALQSLLRLRLARPAVPLAEAAEPKWRSAPLQCRADPWPLTRLMRPVCKPSRAHATKMNEQSHFSTQPQFHRPSAPACKKQYPGALPRSVALYEPATQA